MMMLDYVQTKARILIYKIRYQIKTYSNLKSTALADINAKNPDNTNN